MADIPKVSSSAGVVSGPYHNEIMVCQYVHMTNPRGCTWYGCDPFAFSLPVIMAQFAIIFVLTRSIYSFLKPLKQSILTAQLIGGIIMGKSFLARNAAYSTKLFPPGGRLVLETIADFGFMLHVFLIGVQIDTSLLTKAGRNAVIIGVTSFFFPYVLGGFTVFMALKTEGLDDLVKQSLPFTAGLNALTTFPVIISLLGDLKILNSELGRLATFTSMVSDCCSYTLYMIMVTVGISIRFSQWKPLWNLMTFIAFFLLIYFVLRPLILYIGKQIPEGQSIKETQLLVIVVVVLVTGLCSEALGQTPGLGAFVLGLTVPGGPPLGAALVQKLDVFCSGILLPAKFVICGMALDFSSIKREGGGGVIELVLVLGYIAKFTGTLVPALYYSVPLWEAVALALIMCCKGIIEVNSFIFSMANATIDLQEYTLLLITMLIVTGVARPLVCYLYDPSARYLATMRNSILHSHPNTDLRILVCIHNEDSVPAILNLLEASNPTRQRPISVFVLNLMELTGRAAAVLVPNFRRGKLTSIRSRSEHIVNVFGFFAHRNQGFVAVQHFTAIAPYASMHGDICTIALDKDVAIVIVPFHKQWEIDGRVGSSSPSIRAVNQNVIEKAPCSVGILVDRTQMGGTLSVLTGQSSFRIAILFLGGPDDREALAYASRMAEHPHITLTLVWLRPSGHKKVKELASTGLDRELINQFRANAMGMERIIYREETVRDAVGTTRVLRSLEDGCDLFIVGRHHEPDDSPLTLGLTEWSECPELGVIGDMLATSDFRFSVLVVQQQPPGSGFQSKRFTKSTDGTQVVDSSLHKDPSSTDDSLSPIKSSV